MQNKVDKYLEKLIFKLIIIFYNFNKKKKNPLMG